MPMSSEGRLIIGSVTGSAGLPQQGDGSRELRIQTSYKCRQSGTGRGQDLRGDEGQSGMRMMTRRTRGKTDGVDPIGVREVTTRTKPNSTANC